MGFLGAAGGILGAATLLAQHAQTANVADSQLQQVQNQAASGAGQSQLGANAGAVYQASQPGVAAAEQMTLDNAGLQAGAQQEQSFNELSQGQYNSGLVAFQGHQALANQAEQYNASGVMLNGSPLQVLEQTRQLANAQVANIQNQAMLQAQLYNIQANQTLNAAQANVTGLQNQFNSGLAQANIQGLNVQSNDYWNQQKTNLAVQGAQSNQRNALLGSDISTISGLGKLGLQVLQGTTPQIQNPASAQTSIMPPFAPPIPKNNP